MPDYLPLSAFRQGLLPKVCHSCAWWQTTGSEPVSPAAAADRHRQWMVALEGTWGTTGLLLEGNGAAGGARAPVVVGSISFAPAADVPRLRTLPFTSLPAGAALLFCLTVDANQARSQARRLVHKALAQLKARGVSEAYALADPSGEAAGAGSGNGRRCGFFSADLLAANGFERVMENGGLILMRADLRGLLSLLDQAETAVRRLLRNEPTPSPAAWTHRGTW